MRWSFSAHASFRKCARQWFFKAMFANSRAADPVRREAQRLSKLENVQAWRGKIVDTVISDAIVPSVARGQSMTLVDAQRLALTLFDAERVQRTLADGNGLGTAAPVGAFYEVEYGLPLADEVFANARSDVQRAIENFYRAEPVWNLLRQAHGLFPQRTLTFHHIDVSVQVRPDLILFRSTASPVIFDWKVNARPLRDYWLQLVTGAIAVTCCTPHRDWPSGAVCCGPHEVELLEVQLLAADIRAHRISPADVQDAEDFILISAGEMQFARGDDAITTLTPEGFPVARDPRTCQICAFKKLCWGPVP